MFKKKLENKISDLLTRMYKRLPDAWTGEKTVLKDNYTRLHFNASGEDLDDFIHKTKLFHIKLYALVAVLIAFILLVFFGKLLMSAFIPFVPSYEDVSTNGIDTKIEAEYKGDSVDLDRRLTIGEGILSDEDESELIAATRKRLPHLILDQNPNLTAVSGDLKLISMDELTGVNISWQSDAEAIIDSSGEVNFIQGSKGEDVYLCAWLSVGGTSDTMKIKATLGSPGAAYDIKRAIRGSVDYVVGAIAAGSLDVKKDDKLALPKQTEDGVSLNWKIFPAKLPLTEILVLLFIIFLVYLSRYKKLEKEVREKGENMLRELPDFLSKLTLLLDAGMVFTTAFDRIVSTYVANKESYGRRVLYEEFVELKERMQVSNTSLVQELVGLADRSGKRELMRLAGIIYDSFDKGTDLVDKLKRENSLMLELKKKLAEERGRLAETKLSGPMAIQLIVIIIIAAAPAIMDMQ